MGIGVINNDAVVSFLPKGKEIHTAEMHTGVVLVLSLRHFDHLRGDVDGLDPLPA